MDVDPKGKSVVVDEIPEKNFLLDQVCCSTYQLHFAFIGKKEFSTQMFAKISDRHLALQEWDEEFPDSLFSNNEHISEQSQDNS